MILKLLTSFVFGVILHKLYAPTKLFGERWGNLLRYAIGGLGLIPIQILLLIGMNDICDTNEKKKKIGEIVVADLLALLTLGGGSLTGHLMDKE